MLDIDIAQENYIAGKWVAGQGNILRSFDPMDNNKNIWTGRIGLKEDIERAVNAASKALSDWSLLDFQDRVVYLEKFAEIVQKKKEHLNELISLETGKPLWESATETQSVVGKISISIQAYKERNAEKISTQADAKACLRYKPHGVLAVLGAFNFPAHLSNGHIVPALLAGNTVVYKPSELAPAVAAFIMQCWHESGIPAGVINCVQGDSSTGALLLDADIQAVCFTGSYATGKRIHQHFSARPDILLALEMGGNNPLIIDETLEDMDAAVYHTILSAFITAGQRCSAARRLLIKDNEQGERFLYHLLKLSQQMKIGAFQDKPEPFMGPVISHAHAKVHLIAQEKLIQMGGHCLLPMKLLKPNSGLLSVGFIDMTCVKNPPDEEIFAPLLQVYRYQHFEDALALANQTRYGLTASLFSDNAERYKLFYSRIRAGLINWNKPTTGAASTLPFGGIGCSGNHHPSAYFAADYCAYPVAGLEKNSLDMPKELLPGINPIRSEPRPSGSGSDRARKY